MTMIDSTPRAVATLAAAEDTGSAETLGRYFL